MYCCGRQTVARFHMRFSLLTQPVTTDHTNGAIPLSVVLHSAFGQRDEYSYPTDSKNLLRLLEMGTDLPYDEIERFMEDVFAHEHARLPGIDLSDDALKVIGYL